MGEVEKEVERQYRGTPCSLNNYHSHQRETFQTTVVTKRQSTVRKLVLILSKLLFFYVRDCTWQYKQHVITLKDDTHREYKYAFAHVHACADVLYKIVCAPTQNTHAFEHRGK